MDRKLVAVHSRHDNISQQKRNAVFMLLEQADRFRSVAGFNHFAIQSGQCRTNEPATRGFIIDEQYNPALFTHNNPVETTPKMALSN